MAKTLLFALACLSVLSVLILLQTSGSPSSPWVVLKSRSGSSLWADKDGDAGYALDYSFEDDDDDDYETGVNVPLLYASLPPRIQNLVDVNVDPCVDFYNFACGKYEDRHMNIPKDRSALSYAFGKDADQTVLRAQQILENTVKNVAVPQALLDYYAACTNVEVVEELGMSPIAPYLQMIDNMNSTYDLGPILSEFHQIGVLSFFSWIVVPDHQDPDEMILYLQEGGLGLANEKFYLPGNEAEHKLPYLSLNSALISLVDPANPDPDQAAIDIWELEKKLAGSVHGHDENGKVVPFERCNRTCLNTKYQHFDWNGYFEGWGYIDVADSDHVIVTRPFWMKNLDRLLGSYPLSTIQTYMRAMLARNMGPLLSKPFLDILLAYETELTGRTALFPRWKKCTLGTRTALPFMLSKTYISAFIPASTKEIATHMLDDIRLAFMEQLKMSNWLSAETKAAAINKLNQMLVEVAYPSSWDEYMETSVLVTPLTYAENYMRCMRFKYHRDWNQLLNKTNRVYWRHVPIIANAYYSSRTNSAFVPVGILQDPFYNMSLPASYNYGSVGSVIGHELTHGFDNNGRRFDGEGKMQSWWDHSTLRRFKKASKCFVDLYDSFSVDGVYVNGKKTLGENIADTGGLKTAYYAYLLAAKLNGVQVTPFDKRLFWLAYASTRCGVSRAQGEISNVEAGATHPSRPFRLVGPVSQLAEFARDFKCPAGSPMNPEIKCQLW